MTSIDCEGKTNVICWIVDGGEITAKGNRGHIASVIDHILEKRGDIAAGNSVDGIVEDAKGVCKRRRRCIRH